ncbi:unknown [Crocosphaera subtropica ATCC 51142]|uniref:Phosphatidic acid phosphatase type 2/haloperoxidase domain-containing protein n=1 Tax=Crocosphaera subtropica (strain ATCC 51142 / BH68) TaxID=43989 RepID=B1WZJ0_CROS5|nr:phosphatidic acid phosphatase [Crocosphaera subtropica]ACB51142.1 unknown [Crocosphaera subtropica ATCC 51142]
MTQEQRQSRDFEARRQTAKEVRECTAEAAFNDFIAEEPETNGDRQRFKNISIKVEGCDVNLFGFGSFTKTLKHNDLGLVNPQSFESLLDAIAQGTQEEFEKVILGGGKRLLVNPLNAYSLQLIGNDSQGARMASAPAFDSRNTAVDMVERYWMALCRDVRFDQYDKSSLIQEACEDLNHLGFKKEFGFEVTPQTIFRGPYKGCDVGPHVSQFLLKDFNFGNQPIRQMSLYPREGLDYMTDFETWKFVNNGDIDPTGSDIFDGTRYITTLRDAGQWVHVDFPHQSGLWATIILLGEMAAISQASPYTGAIEKSVAFGSLGGPDITVNSALAAVYGLKHAWFQKWCVHLRLRPEVYAQRLELFRCGILGKPFDSTFNKLLGDGATVWKQTKVLDRIYEHNTLQNIKFSRGNRKGTWLLPMGFPEGSPAHPAYPGGHSAFIAAGATIAKAFFADDPIASPVVPTADGQGLTTYTGSETLTVHGELNKLIANVTLFRDGAGMHWRTDGTTSGSLGTNIATGGNLLGEKLAISMLRDIKETYREEVGTFHFKGITGEMRAI